MYKCPLCTVDDTCCFHVIRLGPRTSVHEKHVRVKSTVTGCDVTNCATTLQGFNKQRVSTLFGERKGLRYPSRRKNTSQNSVTTEEGETRVSGTQSDKPSSFSKRSPQERHHNNSPDFSLDDDGDSAQRSVCRPASGPNNQRKEMTHNAIYKSVSEIDSGLTDSAFSFRLFFSSFSILSSLHRLLFSACFKTLLFVLPSSFPVRFLKSSSFLFFFF